MTSDPRQTAFLALKAIHQKAAFADIALDRLLRQANLSSRDRGLATELTYGSVRRQRTLDALIDQIGKKQAHQQPPDLRLILHLGLYQLRYLNQIPARAAVDTTVNLAKQNGYRRLAGVVNGILRQYERLAQADTSKLPLSLPTDPVPRLGTLHSYPDWIVQTWYDQLQDWADTEALCEALNQPPAIDLRINFLQSSLDQVKTAFHTAGIAARSHPFLPQMLRLVEHSGSIQALPGFDQGWWTVQDSSAQLVSHLLAPKPDEQIIDACAAPGGKTTHMAELMDNRGTIWACDRYPSRLKKIKANCDRLGVQIVNLQAGDSRDFPQFINTADRVLLDAPCSGLGTLHRHADARWRQTPATVAELVTLQQDLIHSASTWVKPGGYLVYATCTLNPAENEQIVRQFLQSHPRWMIDPPTDHAILGHLAHLITPEGWLKVWPHQHQMDGFFMVRLRSHL